MVAVFLSNVMLQHWTDQGRVRLDDDTVTLLAERRTVTLTPAVRFTKLIDGGGDPHRLLGTVKTRTQLVALGAEHYMDSVILGDVGYTVLEGFRGELSPAPRPATTPAVNAPPSRAVVAPVSVNVTQPPAAAPPRPTTSPRHPVVTARPVTEGDDDAAALSALFLSTVREK